MPRRVKAGSPKNPLISSPRMCGRFTRYLPWSEIHRLYRLTRDWEKQRNDAPAYNIAPTDQVPFVTAGENGAHKLREGRWWLVPWWAKEMPKAAMFNARIETADTSGAFKDAFKSKRCLIPADGFYEWTKSPADGGKDPWHIYLPGTTAVLVRGPVGAQREARRHELHDHHRCRPASRCGRSTTASR